MRTDLSSQERKKINTMIIIDVHARDIVDRFVRDSILDSREFEWESQLRFYWEKDVDNAVIRQCTGRFAYGFEYMVRVMCGCVCLHCYLTHFLCLIRVSTVVLSSLHLPIVVS